MGKPQANPNNVMIEDAFGNTITLTNGKITIQIIGVLELTAPQIIVNGRVVTAYKNPI